MVRGSILGNNGGTPVPAATDQRYKVDFDKPMAGQAMGAEPVVASGKIGDGAQRHVRMMPTLPAADKESCPVNTSVSVDFTTPVSARSR
jgi:hypothetical protein